MMHGLRELVLQHACTALDGQVHVMHGSSWPSASNNTLWYPEATVERALQLQLQPYITVLAQLNSRCKRHVLSTGVEQITS